MKGIFGRRHASKRTIALIISISLIIGLGGWSFALPALADGSDAENIQENAAASVTENSGADNSEAGSDASIKSAETAEAPDVESPADDSRMPRKLGEAPTAVESVQITSLTSPNASAYVTNSGNSGLLQIVGNYTLTNDTDETFVRITLKNLGGGSYFSAPSKDVAAGHLTLPAEAGIPDVTESGENINISFSLKGNRGNSGSFTINFPFDHARYDGWLAPGTKIAVITAAADNMLDGAKTLDVLSNTSDANSVSLYKYPSDDVPCGSSANIQFSFYSAANSDLNPPKWRNLPSSDLRLTLEYPDGAVVTNIAPKDAGASGNDDGKGKVVYQLGTANERGVISTGWSSFDAASGAGSFIVNNMMVSFPESKFSVGQTVNIKLVAEYTLAGQETPARVTRDLTFKIIGRSIHMKPGSLTLGGFQSYVSIKNPTSLSSDMSISGIVNAGGDPIPNTRVVWENDSSGNKAYPANLKIANLGVHFKTQLVFNINSVAGDSRAVTAYVQETGSLSKSSTASYNTADLKIKRGEYIDSIEIYPLNNPNDSISQLKSGTALPVRELPTGAELFIYMTMRSWDNGVFPNDTKILHQDYSIFNVKLNWDNESDKASHKSADFAGEIATVTAQISDFSRVYYGDNAPNPVVYYTLGVNQAGDLAPGGEFAATVNYYNSTYTSSDPWKDPVIFVLPPKTLQLTPDQSPTVTKNGAVIGNAQISSTTVGGNPVYKITLPKASIGKSDGSASNLYKFNLTFRITVGTGAGTYYLAKTDSAGYPDTAGLIFGTSQIPNNLFYFKESDSKFFVDSPDYDSNPGTEHLRATGKDAPFTVSGSNEMLVYSDLYNNNAQNGTGVWQNVSTAGAQATVPLGGTGMFRLEVLNRGNTYLGDVYLLNILPQEGDGLGSQWSPTLLDLSVRVTNGSGVDVTSSEGFDRAYSIEYSTAGNPSYAGGGISRTGDQAFAGNAAIADAKSFLFKMTSKRLPPGYKIAITGSILAPSSADTDMTGLTAYNLFTAGAMFYNNQSDTGGTQAKAFTPEKQAFVLRDSGSAALTKSGYVFYDINNDNVFNGNDKAAAGVKVSLYAEDAENPGTPAPAVSAVTFTDENGQYEFRSLTGGNYFIKVEKQSGPHYFYGIQGENSDPKASHVNQTTGMSDMFPLAAGMQAPAGVNAALRVSTWVNVIFRADSLEGEIIDQGMMVFAGSVSLPIIGEVRPGVTVNCDIPAGYRLKPRTPESAEYSLTWNQPEANAVFILEKIKNGGGEADNDTKGGGDNGTGGSGETRPSGRPVPNSPPDGKNTSGGSNSSGVSPANHTPGAQYPSIVTPATVEGAQPDKISAAKVVPGLKKAAAADKQMEIESTRTTSEVPLGMTDPANITILPKAGGTAATGSMILIGIAMVVAGIMLARTKKRSRD